MSHHAAFPGRIVAVHRDGPDVWVPAQLLGADEDEQGWAGTRLVEPLQVLAAALTGALIVATGAGWWLHHTFVVPSRPRRTP